MRVSKTVKEYITKEVEKRLMPKYEAEKAEARRQMDIKEHILEAAQKAALLAWEKSIDDSLAELCEDFIQDNRDEGMGNRPSFYHCNAIMIRDRCYISSVHKWQERFHTEVKRVVDSILVELELGGTKADLERLLNNVGVEG